jgi:type I restriction enzyme M protein
MADDTKKQLETQLWNIANTLRGKMGADEFRDYILGFIFYKYLSERIHLFADDILQHDGVTFAQIDEASAAGKTMLASIREESLGRLGYFLKPSQLFHRVAAKGAQATDNFILEDLAGILKHIEASTLGHHSEDDFEGLFEDIDLGSSKLGKTENQKNELIAKVLTHLDKIDFRLADTEADVLGDAYEYLIGQFASGAGKKAGEFYTPQEVSTILAKIVTTGKKSLKSAYDPTFGSGSLLLRVAKEVTDVGCFYGQEMNPTTYNLARMNMILHGVHYQRFDLRNEDTLEHPAPEHAELRFEAIVANPPFSAEWSASELFNHDERFSAYGKLAPKTKADFAFVQHMVHHLDTGGTMACVLPHGVLFRGAAEGHIRRYLIEDCNYLDAVIGLPANIFYGTGIPTCILVLKKQRENPDDILFIDASQCFEKVGNQNQLRPADIERIVSTYRQRVSVAKLSHLAKLSEVVENDFNLNIPRYVDTFDAEAQVDLAAVSTKLGELEKAMGETDQVIAGFCTELGIKAPV